MSLFTLVKDWLSGKQPRESDEEHPLLPRVVLLLEAAVYDHHLAEEELAWIKVLLTEKHGLDEGETDALLDLARERRDDFPDIHSFTRKMVGEMAIEERVDLMKEIWQVIYADDHLDQHEEHFARKMQTLLRIDHKDWIAAKIEARS
jgi:uncharacterized tellurite resistance protein B-like protein